MVLPPATPEELGAALAPIDALADTVLRRLEGADGILATDPRLRVVSGRKAGIPSGLEGLTRELVPSTASFTSCGGTVWLGSTDAVEYWLRLRNVSAEPYARYAEAVSWRAVRDVPLSSSSYLAGTAFGDLPEVLWAVPTTGPGTPTPLAQAASTPAVTSTPVPAAAERPVPAATPTS